jgi:hypothetical protein
MENNKLIHKISCFLPLAFCIIFAACSDYLDMPSDGRVELKDVFAQRNTIVSYYNSLLGFIPQTGFTYVSGPAYTPTPLAVFCDEAEDVNNQVNGSPYSWYTGASSALNYPLDNGLGAVWNYYFVMIRRCNTFLQQIPDNTATDIKDFEVEGMTAEVRTLRAFAYLQLMKRYGNVPLTDTPFDVTHDYSQDKRASIEDVADFIISECDAALETPEDENQDMAFLWTLRSEGQRGKIPRAFALAVKSQTALYAASPLSNPDNSGKYTWAKAVEITKETLDQCLNHGYELYNRSMNDDMNAKTLNVYGYYFIQRSDPTRALDKETIFESSLQTSIWTNAALPIWQGGLTAGACPSQELVDAYEMQETGEPPVSGYENGDRLKPIINPASGYDEKNPYEGRDPRFYASVYYNGSLRKWMPGISNYLTPQFSSNSRYYKYLTRTGNADGSVTLTTTDRNPYIETGNIGGKIEGNTTYLIFEYKSNKTVNDAYFYALTDTKKSEALTIPQADSWREFRYDLEDFRQNFNFGANSNDYYGFIPSENSVGYEITVRNMKIEIATPPVPLQSVETFVGGNCEISANTSNIRNTRTGYYMRKFNSSVSETGTNDDGYFKIFRLAELYLNFAEAAYNATTPDTKYGDLSALDALNAVRTRAGMPALPAGMEKSAFETRYRNERRVELAFEEHRFFDVRRWKILNETDGGVTGMEITKKEDGTFNYKRVKMVNRATAAEKYLLFPIPQSEVAKMFQYTGTNWQNPGWE